MSEPKKPFHEIVAERIIEQLKAGTAPWQKPWNPEQGGALPYNPVSGKRYKGINMVWLSAQGYERGYEDNRWMTYKQADQLGAQVRKGEKGTLVQYWKFEEERNKLDGNGKPILNSDGKPEKEVVQLERPRVFMATVFNAEQIDGLPPPTVTPKWEQIERAENILNASGAKITYGGDGRAFYRLSSDSIQLPKRESFPTEGNFYSTALHELGHWTGHESRLARDLSHPFGSEGYAKEELRAEIASMMLGDELGIGADPAQHASYVGSWIKAIQDDHFELFRAAADAEKIYGYVLSFEQKREQSTEQELSPEQTNPLSMDIRAVIAESADYDFSHFRSFKGESLEHALRSHGFNTVSDVVGTSGSSLNDTALERLSPVFGLSPHDLDMSNAYLERKGLAQAFALVAEEVLNRSLHAEDISVTSKAKFVEAEDWVIRHLRNKTLVGAMSKATVSQIDKALDTLDSMIPINSENSFWQDRGVPDDAVALTDEIYRVTDKLVNRLDELDAPSLNSAKTDGGVIDEAKKEGRMIYTKGDAGDSFVLPRDIEGLSAIAQHHDGTWSVHLQKNGDLSESVVDFDNQNDAQNLVERTNEAIKQTQLTRDAEKLLSESGGSEKTYLDVPFKDKEEAKSLGAHWDRQKKSWYAPEGADLSQFGKWLNKPKQHGGDEPSNAPSLVSGDKAFIAVPFNEREQAKQAGAKWDGEAKSWFIPDGLDQSAFSKWQVSVAPSNANTLPTTEADAPKVGAEKIYLAVPYNDRELAKEAGAKWDKSAKSWYAQDGNLDKLKRWLPDNVPAQQLPAITPREEFAEALRSLGCIVDGEHPMMDGKKHRIKVEGDKGCEKAGFYVGHLDGHPAGYICNNRTESDMKWKSKGYVLSPEDKAKLQAEAASKLAKRDQKESQNHEMVAKWVQDKLDTFQPISEPTPYLKRKGIDVHKGIYTDSDGERTYIPAYDLSGKTWTMQTISPDGEKRFTKNSKKAGCFHVVGGLESLKDAPILVVAEGYATAATLTENLGFGVVAALDAGNMAHVAEDLRNSFPDKPMLIAGDDDKRLVFTQGKNKGKEHAESLAERIGATAFFPVFTPEESTYSPNVPPVTPETYKAHRNAEKLLGEYLNVDDATPVSQEVKDRSSTLIQQLLSRDQLFELDKLAMHKDFNDLATVSVLGKEGLDRQVKAAVKLAQDKHQKSLNREQVQTQQPQVETKQKRGVKLG